PDPGSREGQLAAIDGGQVVGPPGQIPGKARVLEDLERSVPDLFGGGQVVVEQGQFNVFERCQVVDKNRILENEARFAADGQAVAGVPAGEVGAEQPDRAVKR